VITKVLNDHTSVPHALFYVVCVEGHVPTAESPAKRVAGLMRLSGRRLM
jgi:hypothetical protein